MLTKLATPSRNRSTVPSARVKKILKASLFWWAYTVLTPR